MGTTFSSSNLLGERGPPDNQSCTVLQILHSPAKLNAELLFKTKLDNEGVNFRAPQTPAFGEQFMSIFIGHGSG